MTDLDSVRSWAEDAPFAKLLGIAVDSISPEQARLSLGFKEELSNGDTALHGGVAGSLIVTAAGCVARAALGPEAGTLHTAAVQVAYLSAALGEGLSGTATLLRRGKELVHVEVDVKGDGGKAIAKGLVTVRSRPVGGAGPEDVAPDEHRHDESELDDPGPMGPFIGSIPFHAALGISAEHMAGGRSRIVMPHSTTLTAADGAIHEGPVMALLDTTGAMAAWAKTGPGRFKASTPVLQGRILARSPGASADGLVGYGRVVHHDGELLLCDVEIRAGARRGSAGNGRRRGSGGALVAAGTVNYRIVLPA